MLKIPEKAPELGFYYHYKYDPKGQVNNYAYEVVGVGFHTEDNARPGVEYFLVYRPLYEASVYKASKQLGIPCFDNRPLGMWMENVTKDGKIEYILVKLIFMEDSSLEIEPVIMSEDDLIRRINTLKEKLEKVEAEHHGKSFMFEELKRLYERFIEELIGEKDLFKYIFKTELGSIYFVLHNGKSFRIKNKKYGYELQPIMDKIDFYNGDFLDNPEIGATPSEVAFYKDGRVAKHHGHKISEIIK